jgi:N-acetylmuramoyl-L-alanine amidase
MRLRHFLSWKFEYVFVAPEQWQREHEKHFVLAKYELLSVWDATNVLRQLSHRDPKFLAELARAVLVMPVRPGLEPMLQELIRGLGRPSPRAEQPPNFASFYVARRKRERTFQELPDPWKEVREAIEAAERAPRGFIVVEAVTDEKEPLPVSGLRVEFLVADGQVRTTTTDGTGQARLDPIPQGQCHIILPTLDGGSWRPTQGTSSPVRGRQSDRVQWHRVERGESLSRIAHHYGVKNWQKLWDHPKNQPLRKKRKDPNVLLVGDEVAIGGMAVHEIIVPTDQVHRILISMLMNELNVTFLDFERQPMKEKSYDFEYEGPKGKVTKSGQLTADGVLREEVPASVAIASVTFADPPCSFELRVGALDPVEDDETKAAIISGVQARLSALGHGGADARGALGPSTRLALQDFQRTSMGKTDPSGEVDAETRGKLVEVYRT